MFQYAIRRILISIPILLVVLTLVFVVVRVLPGDPAVAALGDQASKEAVEALRAKMGLNDPLWLQYLKFLGSLCRGDLGTSIISGFPVAAQIASVVPYTLELTFLAVFLGYLFGIPLGFITIYGVSRLTPPPSQELQDFVESVRTPRGAESGAWR